LVRDPSKHETSHLLGPPQCFLNRRRANSGTGDYVLSATRARRRSLKTTS
jgi:hypothetical protein